MIITLYSMYTDTKYDADRDKKRLRQEKAKKIKEYHDALKKKKQKESKYNVAQLALLSFVHDKPEDVLDERVQCIY